MLENEKITIDDTEYNFNDLSIEAQKQILNIRFVDSQLQQLRSEWAVADTARIGYTNALKADSSNLNDDE